MVPATLAAVANLSWIVGASRIESTFRVPAHGHRFRPTLACFPRMIAHHAAAAPILQRV
jgi:hypothetical protein